MGSGDTLTVWREKLIQKLREHGVPEADVERRADELTAPMLVAHEIAEAHRQKTMRRLRAMGWPDDKIEQALVELTFRRGDRLIRQQKVLRTRRRGSHDCPKRDGRYHGGPLAREK
ncbi:hypothetical protein AA309_19150 [Microvirga vignae]|uniref:Uncharacterized protein n=1 Tax=Microvirga vignae TaxID=1225564 RepID=A0A0H1R8T2_9HYPH|nr:hypothetical protein [Microvirga vignae]KLK91640.1 hypothetical protein AA309_19150 [Microvirga vignae]